ncbi:MAG: BMP family ABC transporter substrate-binding protein, partial [Sphaerochaetaceae bacterium]|nr:BMP family ABC transporter substrate-binding protein [Sphaerochaetaceae bacterium]
AVIAGGAAQGLCKVDRERGAYVGHHNTNEYDMIPPYVVGSGSMEQKKVTMEALQEVIDGTVAYGKASVVGLVDGYVRFIDEDPLYEQAVPRHIRDVFSEFLSDLSSGEIPYTLPAL